MGAGAVVGAGAGALVFGATYDEPELLDPLATPANCSFTDAICACTSWSCAFSASIFVWFSVRAVLVDSGTPAKAPVSSSFAPSLCVGADIDSVAIGSCVAAQLVDAPKMPAATGATMSAGSHLLLVRLVIVFVLTFAVFIVVFFVFIVVVFIFGIPLRITLRWGNLR